MTTKCTPWYDAVNSLFHHLEELRSGKTQLAGRRTPSKKIGSLIRAALCCAEKASDLKQLYQLIFQPAVPRRLQKMVWALWIKRSLYELVDLDIHRPPDAKQFHQKLTEIWQSWTPVEEILCYVRRLFSSQRQKDIPMSLSIVR